MDPQHIWDDGSIRFGDGEMVIGEHLFGAILRHDLRVPEHSRLAGSAPRDVGKQGLLVGKLEKLKWDELREQAGEWDRARFESVAAPHAGAWLSAPPSRALDFLLTNAEVRSRVGRRLGVQVCEETTCPFCFGIMDKWGIHKTTVCRKRVVFPSR